MVESGGSCCFLPLVAVVEATYSGRSNELGVGRWPVLRRPTEWRISQSSVDSVFVVVLDVFAEETMEVILVQDDYVIQQLSTSAADPSLGNLILPWTP